MPVAVKFEIESNGIAGTQVLQAGLQGVWLINEMEGLLARDGSLQLTGKLDGKERPFRALQMLLCAGQWSYPAHNKTTTS
jgi:hypothetical protein